MKADRFDVKDSSNLWHHLSSCQQMTSHQPPLLVPKASLPVRGCCTRSLLGVHLYLLSKEYGGRSLPERLQELPLACLRS